MPATDYYAPLSGNEESRAAVSLSGAVISDLMVLVLVAVAAVGSLGDRPLVTALAALVFVLVVVSRLWARLSLEDIQLGLSLSSPRVVAGEEVTLTFVIENRKPLPVPWLRVLLPLQRGLEVLDENLVCRPYLGGMEVELLTSLGAYDRVLIRVPVKARRRGVYRIDPVRLGSGDLFGFYLSRRELYRSTGGLVVYPQTMPLENFSLPPARPVGDAWRRDFLSEDPNRPSSVREYRPGDPVKSIDWKATARRGQPFVRTYDPSMSRQIVILLECDTPKVWRWRRRPDALEACVVVAASVALRCHEAGNRVGLVANGIPPDSATGAMIPPGCGVGHLPTLMEALAVAQPYSLRSLDRLMQDHGAAAIPYGATFVYVTAVFHAGTVDFLRRLSMRGCEVLVLDVSNTGLAEISSLPVRDLSHAAAYADDESTLAPGSAAHPPKGGSHG